MTAREAELTGNKLVLQNFKRVSSNCNQFRTQHFSVRIEVEFKLVFNNYWQAKITFFVDGLTSVVYDGYGNAESITAKWIRSESEKLNAMFNFLNV